jgi:hypothetical protein
MMATHYERMSHDIICHGIGTERHPCPDAGKTRLTHNIAGKQRTGLNISFLQKCDNLQARERGTRFDRQGKRHPVSGHAWCVMRQVEKFFIAAKKRSESIKISLSDPGKLRKFLQLTNPNAPEISSGRKL